jgi:hypothetical protein
VVGGSVEELNVVFVDVVVDRCSGYVVLGVSLEVDEVVDVDRDVYFSVVVAAITITAVVVATTITTTGSGTAIPGSSTAISRGEDLGSDSNGIGIILGGLSDVDGPLRSRSCMGGGVLVSGIVIPRGGHPQPGLPALVGRARRPASRGTPGIHGWVLTMRLYRSSRSLSQLQGQGNTMLFQQNPGDVNALLAQAAAAFDAGKGGK